MPDFFQKIKDWFFEDNSDQISKILDRIENLGRQISRMENELKEIKEEKKSSWNFGWPALSALGTCGALGFSLYLLCTV